MATLNEYYPEMVLHPSSTLNEKLEEMKMSRKEFALRTGKPEKTIIAILKGESSVTPEMAVLFENITKIPAHFWINKQARYNEYKARLNRKKDVEQAVEWTKKFPYSEMAKQNWVPKTRNIEERTINLFDYFAVATHEGWQKLYMESELKVAAYASLKHTLDPYAISAWLRKGELQADQISIPKFNVKVFKENLQAIKEIMINQSTGFFTQLQNLCFQAGVKVFYTPKLPKVPINGSTRWIKDTPVIQLTARYKQNDRFWFTFFHEAGHIILHGKKYISLENIDFSEADPEKEKQAHKFAEELIFSKEQEKEVLAKDILLFDDIIMFSKKFNTHPAIIIGRLQHLEKIPYSVGREYVVPINLSEVDQR